MRKLVLQKIKQHGTTCYIGKIDPRVLVRVATKVEMSTTQDAQRPLNEKRVKDISDYVGNDYGILPNTLTLATKDSKYNVKPLYEDDDIYYIDFPDTEVEYQEYENSIDAMDGQHRLYSFLPNIRLIQEDAKYEIGFTLYIRPTLEERRRIFISCNEKQEKVSPNLLLWFKEKLNMLSENDRIFYGVVSKLSKEYPLKGHVIMSAEKMKNGVKAKEIIAALTQAKVQDLTVSGIPLTEDQKVKVICMYLTAWENTVGFSFSTSSKKTAGAAITMAGLKYMLLLLPTIWERSIAQRKSFDTDFVEDCLKRFISSLAIEREEFFICEENKMCFRDRTAIDLFANQSIIKIKDLAAEDFNPLAALV